VGYCTVSEKELILEAILLGVARSELAKQLLTMFSLKEGQDIYYLHRKQAEEEIRKLNEDLQQMVNERTTELRETIAMFEETNRVFVGRELRMIELKERIAELKSVKRIS
jgi:hypothetical protein